MEAIWNNDRGLYTIEMSEWELGTLLYGLTVAKYETKDAGVAEIHKEFLDLNNSDEIVGTTEEATIWLSHNCNTNP